MFMVTKFERMLDTSHHRGIQGSNAGHSELSSAKGRKTKCITFYAFVHNIDFEYLGDSCIPLLLYNIYIYILYNIYVDSIYIYTYTIYIYICYMTIPMSHLAYLNCKLGNHTCCMLTRGYPLDPSGKFAGLL